LHYTEKAMRRCKLGIPVATAAKRHKVPRTTLLYKKTGKYPVERKIGAPTVLKKEEEAALVTWLKGDRGFPVTKEQLMESVRQIIKNTEKP
jgi:hypothetical protein